MRVKTLSKLILLLSLSACKPVVFDSLPQTPMPFFTIPPTIVSTDTLTSTPLHTSTAAPDARNISDYYGVWIITGYKQDRTGGPFTEEDAERQIGKTIELTSTEMRFDDDFLSLDIKYCPNASYDWSTPDDFVGHLWQALLPNEHPDRRDDLLHLKVNCDGKMVTGFEVSKTGKLVTYVAFYWFFLDRDGSSPSATSTPSPLPK